MEVCQIGLSFSTPICSPAGEQWRALTRIKVRKEPSINSPQLEDKVIEKGRPVLFGSFSLVIFGVSCVFGDSFV
jgi:hypothetical protein